MRIKRRRDKILKIEQELFEKIVDQVEKQGMTIETAFKNFDSNTDGNIDMQELMSGFSRVNISVSKNE